MQQYITTSGQSCVCAGSVLKEVCLFLRLSVREEEEEEWVIWSTEGLLNMSHQDNCHFQLQVTMATPLLDALTLTQIKFKNKNLADDWC